MLELEDEQIIIASTLIALENKLALKVEHLSKDVYSISRNIGMKRFSDSSFNQIVISLVIPVLNNAGLLHLVKKSSNSPYMKADEIDQNTICRLTKKALENMKKIRKGIQIKSGDEDQNELFNNIFKIINGHLDEGYEQDAFKRHMDGRQYIPQVKLGKLGN